MATKQTIFVFFAAIIGVFSGFFLNGVFFDSDSPTTVTEKLHSEDVNAIVAQFVKDNPKAIIDSVTEYQQTGFYEDIEKLAQAFRSELETVENVSFIGNPKGAVKVVEFFDYQCPHCKANFPVIERLVAEEPEVVILPKHLPILGDGGPNDMSLQAAKFAEAARMQGKFLEFHTRLMERDTALTEELMLLIAQDLGLDLEKLLVDAESQEVTNTIARSLTIAEETGLRQAGTPSYLIGGETIIGAGENSYARLKNKVEIVLGYES